MARLLLESSATDGYLLEDGSGVLLLNSTTATLDVGAFTLTGVAVAFKKAWTFPMSMGSFTLTGNAAAFQKALRLALAVGTFSLTGNATAFQKALHLGFSAGTFTLTGNTVEFQKALRLSLSTGVFSLTGNAAEFPKALHLGLSAGAFSLTGSATEFQKALHLLVGTGSFSLTGNAGAFAKALHLILSSGSFVFIGNDADFVYDPAQQNLVLTANVGVFTMSGKPVGLIWTLAPTINYLTTNGQVLSYALPNVKRGRQQLLVHMPDDFAGHTFQVLNFNLHSIKIVMPEGILHRVLPFTAVTIRHSHHTNNCIITRRNFNNA